MKKEQEKKVKKIPTSLKFLFVVIVLYVAISFFNIALIKDAIVGTVGMLVKIVPILVVVFAIMIAINLFMESGKIKKYFGKDSGVKGWISAIVGGVLVSGPPYVLYPMLKELKRAGMKDSLLAVFLYNRNVKIPFIPVMIYYFGLGYTVIFSIYIIIFSIPNGILIGRLMKKEK